MSAVTERNKAARAALLCEEVEWQLKLGQGWWQAMRAVGYTSQQALYRQLCRSGRHDLAAVFNPDLKP